MPMEEEKIGVVDRGFSGVRFERSPRWVRVRSGGVFVADSKRAHLLFAPKKLPVYYFPLDDVRVDLLTRSGRSDPTDRGTRVFWHVGSGVRRAESVARTYENLTPEWAFLEGFIAFRWDAMEAWFEEDDEVFVHARDPYHRVDALQSSRHVQVKHAGHILAETRRPLLLFETGLPTRYYIPKLDVRLDLLEASQTRTQCPYKGEAVYWSMPLDGRIEEDLAWSYPAPIPECLKIENAIAFFQEKVDAIIVDGEAVEVPETPWSPRKETRAAG